MQSFLKDIRYGLRKLFKNPGFTAVALITLALGIGANTAIFSIVYSVLLKSLPYKEPDKVVSVSKVATDKGLPGIAAYEYLDWKEQNTTFEQLAAFTNDNFNLTGIGEPERIPCAQVTANTFPMLGVVPLKGRVFTAEEDKPGSNQVVVVSEKFWQRTFGNDKALSGQSITLNDKSYTVVGIMQNGFRFPGEYEVWMPLALDEVKERHGDEQRLIEITGRLKNGATTEQARAEFNVIAKRTAETFSKEKLPPANVDVIPLHKQLVTDYTTTILVLFGVAGFVLLIACVNVANLMLARAANRQKEIGIRVAIGANRWQLFRQLLIESTLLGLIGGVLGIILAIWGISVGVSLIPADLANSIHGLKDVNINGQVLFFTLIVSVFSGIIFGLAPSLIASKTDVNRALSDATAGQSAGFGLRTIRGWLVVVELALAFVLLVGAGLMIRSFNRKLEIKPGFNAENVLTMRVELPPSRYPKGAMRAGFYQRVLERTAALPGVQSVGAISHKPLGDVSNLSYFKMEGLPPLDRKTEKPITVGMVTPNYFIAMGIPLLNGRFFNDGDAFDGAQVMLVNEAFVRKFYPNENPVGKRTSFTCDKQELCRTIVGVVGNIKQESLITDAVPEGYVPVKQWPAHGMTFVFKTTNEPLSMAGTIREQISAEDKDQPVYNIKTLDQKLKEAIAQTRAIMLLFTVFSGLALLLSSVGIYGVMSYAVTQRTREIGIRMALGAGRFNILNFIMKQGLLMTLIGVGIGIVAAVMLTRLMASLLFGISPTDTFTFIGIAFLLLIIALLACFIPARKATKIDPLTALRHE